MQCIITITMDDSISVAFPIVSASFVGFTDESILATHSSLWTISKNKYSYSVRFHSYSALQKVINYCEESSLCIDHGINGDIYRYSDGYGNTLVITTVYKSTNTLHVQGKQQAKWLIECLSAISSMNFSLVKPPSTNTSVTSFQLLSPLPLTSRPCTSTPIPRREHVSTTSVCVETQTPTTYCEASTQTCSTLLSVASQTEKAIQSSQTQTTIDSKKINEGLTKVRKLKESPCMDKLTANLPRESPQSCSQDSQSVTYCVHTSNSFNVLTDEVDQLLADAKTSTDASTSGSKPAKSPPKKRQSTKTPEQSFIVEDKSTLPSSYHSSLPANTPNQPSERPLVIILGDSIPKYLVGRKLSRRYRVVNHCIPGMTLQKLAQFVPLLIGDEKPSFVIVHCGTNNISSHNTSQIMSLFQKLHTILMSLNESTRVAYSGLTGNRNCLQTDIYVCQVNNRIREFCADKHCSFIDNYNITLSHLSRDGVHLNRSGIIQLARNFISFLRSTYSSSLPPFWESQHILKDRT